STQPEGLPLGAPGTEGALLSSPHQATARLNACLRKHTPEKASAEGEHLSPPW
ncbi:Hypothetical predicted protein, partial [Marmota monax]